MHLEAQLLEDARGRQELAVRLYLHGPVDWPRPEGLLAWSRFTPRRLVGPAARTSMGGHRTLASLTVLAPDHVETSTIKSALAVAVAKDRGAWEHHDSGVSVAFSDQLTLFEQPSDGLRRLTDAVLKRLVHRHSFTPLKVLGLKLEGFRGIDNLTLDLSSSATSVLAGVNGAGKTSILRAITLLLWRIESDLREDAGRAHDLEEDDIANGRDSATLEVSVALEQQVLSWAMIKSRGDERASEAADTDQLSSELAGLRRAAVAGEARLPLVVYYPVNRAVLDIPVRIRTTHSFAPLEAFDGALKGGRSNFRLFFEWFRDREDLENEVRIEDTNHRDGQLEAVRRAMSALAPGFSGLRVQRAPLRMVVTKGEWTLYVDQLSDGEKCLLAMAGDLARRLAIANPLMDDPLRGGGVVLIDEIELHLHPGWQRHIIPALERTFPNCQFIVTTHSPAVLGHVPHEAIHVLDATREGVIERRPDASLGMDANRILEDLLQVPERSVEFKEKLLRLYRLIDEGHLEEARALHGELAEVLGPGAPELARAEVRLMRRERSGR